MALSNHSPWRQKNNSLKIILLLVITGLIVSFFYFDLQQFLTLATLKSGLAQFSHWRDNQPILVGGGFLLLYLLVTALSLPGAAVMSLAGGALFGLFWGTLLVSFGSSLGATLAFLASRYLFRDFVQARFGAHLAPLHAGIEREGAFYLFSLRLIPVVPFFMVNLLMGLTPIKVRTFYGVSQIGMLVGTIIYVNAGTQLAQFQSLSGILSPQILGSLVLLGAFPLLVKKIFPLLQARWNARKKSNI